MKNIIKYAKSILLVSLFTLSFAFAGCSADALTGSEEAPPNAQSECNSECPNPHNL